MVDVKTPRIKSSVFLVEKSVPVNFFFTYFPKLPSYQTLSHNNLPITSRSQKKDEDIGDEKDSADY